MYKRQSIGHPLGIVGVTRQLRHWLVTAAETQQVYGVTAELLAKHRLVVPPVAGVGAEAMDQDYGAVGCGALRQRPADAMSRPLPQVILNCLRQLATIVLIDCSDRDESTALTGEQVVLALLRFFLSIRGFSKGVYRDKLKAL